MNFNPVGIFDSGIGGLSIAQAVWKILPNESTIYLADHQYFPYGQKTNTQINDRLIKAVKFFKKHQVKLIIIACNTATVVALKKLRQKLNFPFIGTVPAIKPAVTKNQQGKIVILSTSKTSASNYLKKLKTIFDKQDQTVILACPQLAQDIENYASSSWKIKQSLKKYLTKIPKNCSAVVLGCTHYILIKDILRKMLPQNIKIIEPSQAIARQTKKILLSKNLPASKNNQPIYKFFTTAHSQKASHSASSLLKTRIIFTSCSL